MEDGLLLLLNPAQGETSGGVLMTDSETLTQIAGYLEAIAFVASFAAGMYTWRLCVLFKNQRHFW